MLVSNAKNWDFQYKFCYFLPVMTISLYSPLGQSPEKADGPPSLETEQSSETEPSLSDRLRVRYSIDLHLQIERKTKKFSSNCNVHILYFFFCEQDSSPSSSKPVAVVAPYDEVTEDEIRQRPTRKAPPPPQSSTVAAPSQPAFTTTALTGVASRLQNAHKRRSGDAAEQQQHRYEEIAASETASLQQQPQDLSPIYEEIPGGSRSSVSSSGSGSGRSVGSPR